MFQAQLFTAMIPLISAAPEVPLTIRFGCMMWERKRDCGFDMDVHAESFSE
jgi:hypothetical protein